MIHVCGGGQYLWSMGRGKRILLGGDLLWENILRTPQKCLLARTTQWLKSSLADSCLAQSCLSFCLSVFLSFLPFHPDITLIKCEKRLKSLSRSLCPNSKFYVLRWPLIIFFEVLWTWLWDVGIVEMLADVSEFQFFKDICLLRLRCVQSFTMITVFCLKVWFRCPSICFL